MRSLQPIPVIAIALFAVATGCSQKSSTSEGGDSAVATPAVTLVNSVCPMKGEPVDKTVTVEWNGKTVGFCCADCIPGWNELSDEEKEAKLAAAAEQGAAEHKHDQESDSPVTE